jgi:signal transduction histidine kinase
MLDSSQVKIKKYVNLSINCASSQLFLVNDLIDSSQLEIGKLNILNFEKIDTQSIISPVLQLLKFHAKKNGVCISCTSAISRRLKFLSVATYTKKLRFRLIDTVSSRLS